MSEWVVAAIVLLVATVPLGALCVWAPAVDGLVALEVAGVNAALILLLLSEGFARQPFADLALVMIVLSFAGSLAYVRFLERRA